MVEKLLFPKLDRKTANVERWEVAANGRDYTVVPKKMSNGICENGKEIGDIGFGGKQFYNHGIIDGAKVGPEHLQLFMFWLAILRLRLQSNRAVLKD